LQSSLPAGYFERDPLPLRKGLSFAKKRPIYQEEPEDDEDVIFDDPEEFPEDKPSLLNVSRGIPDYISNIPKTRFNEAPFWSYFTPIFINLIRYFLGVIIGKPRTGKTTFVQELVLAMMNDQQGLYREVKVIAAIPSVWDDWRTAHPEIAIQLLGLTPKIPPDETKEEKAARRKLSQDKVLVEIIEARQIEVAKAKDAGEEPPGLVLVFDDLAPVLKRIEKKLQEITIATANFRTTILVISQDMYLVPTSIRQAADLIAITGLEGDASNFIRDFKYYANFGDDSLLIKTFKRVLADLVKNNKMIIIKKAKSVETGKIGYDVANSVLDWHASLSYYVLDKPFIARQP
jgi:hypothetical protein